MESKEIISKLSPHLTEARLERLQSIVKSRTRSVVTVLESPYDAGNINAAMRSAEAFGFQDFHITKGPKRMRPTGRTSAGAGKWLTIKQWESSEECFNGLRDAGYKLVGTAAQADQSISDYDFSKPTALVFGSEHDGLSSFAKNNIDQTVSIPIAGMVESFNLSVSVAISLYQAYLYRSGSHFDLSAKDQKDLLAQYMIKSVPSANKILSLKA